MLPGTTFTIPEGFFALRGTPEALIGWIEQYFRMAAETHGWPVPLPAPVATSSYASATEPVETFHVWLYADLNPDVRVQGDGELNVDYLPAGYEILT